MKTALYRHFDASDTLLYVGISLSPVDRLAAHTGGAHWAQDIVRVTIEWLPSRASALDAERLAIVNERPLHNIAGRALSKSRKVEPPPRVPRYVTQPEKVAAHYGVSLRAIDRAIREGMPREQISPKRFRYELGACDDWFRARAVAATASAAAAKEAAAKAAHQVLAEAMERALGSAGRKP